MISLTSAQLDAWIAAFIFPLARILALVASAPLFSNVGVPNRTRLALGMAIALGLAPMLPPMPAISPTSWQGLWVLLQQMLIGIGMGFAMRIVFSAVTVAGDLMGAQMGLGFATFYDPLSSAQTPVITEFTNLMTLLVFIALNGPLLYVATLSQSFSAIPVSAAPLAAVSWRNLAELGAVMFSTGLLLALPVIISLIITNLALGVLTRAAPQLNIFAVGFPLTLLGGLAALALTLNYLAAPLQALIEQGLSAMLAFAQLAR